MKKRTGKAKTIVVVCVIACVVVGGVIFLGLPGLVGTGSTPEISSNMTSASVTRGDISSTVVVTGNIEPYHYTAELPSGVKFDTVLVSKDDTVRKGDPFATISSDSVTSAITSAKDSLVEIEDEIDAIQNKDKNTIYITSPKIARVKEIYAEADKKASGIVKKNGSLMVLSTDGKMGVNITASPKSEGIAVGDELTVVLSDKSTTTGTVAQTSSGGFTVTVTDYGTDTGEKVTVKSDGKTLGKGELFIHSPLHISESRGSIGYVNVSKDQYVYKGSTLFTLKIPQAETSYTTLMEKQASLLADIEELYALRATTIFAAPAACTVSAISEAAITYDKGDKFKLSVSVDELDIASIAEGQEVSVTLDALEGETFSGVVSEVSDVGDTSSSVPKYAVTIDVNRTKEMKTGMSATATIIKEKKENVVMIPLDAVQEYGDDVYVSTSTSETGELAGNVKIETGLSDGTNVEVLSGLEEGQTVYYTLSITDSTNQGMMFGGMGQTRMMISGDGPPGGGARRSSDSGGSSGGDGGGTPPQ